MSLQPGPATIAERTALLSVLAAAAILRFHALALLPPALYRDVALAAFDALRAAAGHPRLHYAYDEGLYSNLMGLGFLLFGPSDWSVRAPGSLIGVLTCWGVWRLGRALGIGRAGLFGAAVLSVSFWHVLLSRSGFRAVLLPCLLVHSAALLVEGLRRGGTGRLVAAGILFGLGVHVYPAARFSPLLLPLYLWAEWRRSEEPARRAILRGLAWFAAAGLLAALPMLLHYLRHPDVFLLRHRVVSIFSPGVPPEAVPGHLGRGLLATVLMFHGHGDDNWRHNLAGAPMLDPVTGLLFLVGLAGLVRGPLDARARALLLPWLLAMLLPNVLSVQGVPHGLRSSGVLPAVALVAGIGLHLACAALARRAGERPARSVAIAILAVVGCLTAYRYFGVWGRDPRVPEEHDAAYRAAARLLLAAPPGARRLLVANGTGARAYGHPAEVFCYLWEMRESPPVILGPKDTPRLVLGGRPALVALVRQDEGVLDLIRALNPGAVVERLAAPGLSPASPVYRVIPPGAAAR
jgi:4-amino-4-deoxy-L-arabinose transferase-like glycosyltransferase